MSLSEVADDLIVIARVARTRGLRGEVVADLYTDFPERFEGLEHVIAGKAVALRIAASEPFRERQERTVAGARALASELLSAGSGVNSSHVHERGSSTAPWIENVHSSSGVRSVGPPTGPGGRARAQPGLGSRSFCLSHRPQDR